MKWKGLRAPWIGSMPSWARRRSATYSRYSLVSVRLMPAMPPPRRSWAKVYFAFHGFLDHLYDLLAELVVEQVGFFLAGGGDDFQGEVHVAAFVAEHPVGAGGEAVEQPFGAQEINIGERREEEQPFYAGGEADEVEEEPLAVLAGLEGGELVDGIYPAEAEVGFSGRWTGCSPRRRRLRDALAGRGCSCPAG